MNIDKDMDPPGGTHKPSDERTALFVAAAQRAQQRREQHTTDTRQAVREYTAAAARKIREALGPSASGLGVGLAPVLVTETDAAAAEAEAEAEAETEAEVEAEKEAFWICKRCGISHVGAPS
ncbi:24ffade4-e0d2-4c05-a3f8-f388b0fd890c [Thermothielavioides terrestris]|uniref:24ffade4-e0d2-4c05-a3f8-f388b0fd890c n=1 Tax=Thermothielavioides terrestris TaxID=2587410 RepID=A0A3S4BG23_9PEZI|nr:24ffade4-e0d2-4c05-a3f8-f388b0fd890c [Thermothielavioides terrestris]